MLENAKSVVKVGDCIRYKISPTSPKTSWGIVVNCGGANVKVDDKDHYRKVLLRHWELVEEILSEAPELTAQQPKAPKAPVGPVAANSTPVPLLEDKPLPEWTPEEFNQPTLPKGEKVTKNIGGVEITLTKGLRYKMAIPGGVGLVRVNAYDEVGAKSRATISIIEEDRRGNWKEVEKALYLSLHPSMYKQVQAAFPAGLAW